MASTLLEDVAQQDQQKSWFQIQFFQNRKATNSMIQRAVGAGYKAIVVTVDMPVIGNRYRNTKNSFKLPQDCLPVNIQREELLPTQKDNFKARFTNFESLFDSCINWDDMHKLKQTCSLPIIVKGILHPDDAKMAAQTGMDGIIVSNHGGRQLGAKGVLLGRPILWGLALGGHVGVAKVITQMKEELIRAMQLCGVHSIHTLSQGEDIDKLIYQE